MNTFLPCFSQENGKQILHQFNQDIIEISSGNLTTLITIKEGNVYQYSERNSPSILKLDISNIKQAKVGFSHFILLTNDGIVFGKGSTRSAYGRSQNDKLDLNYPNDPFYEIEFFKQNHIFIKAIKAGCCQSYFLTNQDDLYACGVNSNGDCGIKEFISKITEPKLIYKGVKRVFSEDYSFFMFFEDLEGNFFASGRNEASQLGIGTNTPPKGPTKVPQLSGQRVIDISCGYQHSAAVIEDELGFHQIWIAGGSFKPDDRLFRKVQNFDSQKVLNISSHCWTGVLLTAKGELFIFSKFKDFHPQPLDFLYPYSNYLSFYRIEIGSSSIIYPAFIYKSFLIQDLENLLQNRILTDISIQSIDNKFISAHKIIILKRLCENYENQNENENENQK
ncbi:ubiquitin-protein ligase e3a-related [Anaeramoeba ignava]|uniref:Ubiquitin-protein ligase e3a-related n=1 Tax=Anaeramoeba ignava TaxID=1746090 RepID=A0A9Q0LGK7_ANAIG|nr:ubiquitin-protein ligase e3a-related [Anaeramoeba ignava]